MIEQKTMYNLADKYGWEILGDFTQPQMFSFRKECEEGNVRMNFYYSTGTLTIQLNGKQTTFREVTKDDVESLMRDYKAKVDKQIEMNFGTEKEVRSAGVFALARDIFLMAQVNSFTENPLVIARRSIDSAKAFYAECDVEALK